MIEVNFYDLNTIKDSKLKFAVIVSKYNGQWVYVKHNKRNTWEIPGGHREENETIERAAERELFEETGATRFKLTPVCVYSVERSEEINYTESFGQLFYAEIAELDELPNSEIEKIKLCGDIPNELTYPLIQPFLHNKILEFLSVDK